MKFDIKALARHVAGRSISHRSEFEALEVANNEDPLTQDFLDLWVAPFYMKHPAEQVYAQNFADRRERLTDAVVELLLGDFNWRMRSVGATFAAIREDHRQVDQIGKLLLRSDVCYAGKNYSVALASLNSDKGLEYLERYLEYYLGRSDLYFDQAEAMAALVCLDEKRNESRHHAFLDRWEAFTKDKPNWSLDRTLGWFRADLEAIEKLGGEQDAAPQI